MNRYTRPTLVLNVFSLLLGLACASALAGERHDQAPTSHTLFYACMSTNEYLKSEYDSAAFEAINPGTDAKSFNPFYQKMSSAFAEYLQQKYGFKGIVQCGQHSTLAEAKQWLQWRTAEIARVNFKYIATDWTYSADPPDPGPQ